MPSNEGLKFWLGFRRSKICHCARACPGVASCAGIVQFAAGFFLGDFRVNHTGYRGAAWTASRVAREQRDSRVPAPAVLQLLPARRQLRCQQGLSVDDLVVLFGSHTNGRSHCSSFSDRITTPPSDMNLGLAVVLKGQCPASPNFTDDPTVVQDGVTPDRLDKAVLTSGGARIV
ncbi:peroxidase 2 [Sorghum bicolor]|uniref:peroxidase 2 n=1 Tax=Sorghum bicolor TaxID=4558 RepID=UPI000B42421D|nr:peroxidase 2 [Sorghum bicolor]|eukprot:XP_002461101.2 peroxidase 2 [Sorghum bicolor]